MLAAGCGLQCDEAHSWFIILFYNERMMSFSACFFSTSFEMITWSSLYSVNMMSHDYLFPHVRESCVFRYSE